jgi:hypothetical protein
VFEFPHVVRVEEDFKAERVKKKIFFQKKCFGTFCPQLIGPALPAVGPTAPCAWPRERTVRQGFELFGLTGLCVCIGLVVCMRLT